MSESNTSKILWKAVMQRVHENLPSESFPMPSGIVQETICSRSGKLPIPGLCDGTLRAEYFAEGTVPTESCDVHYEGDICNYDRLPASPDCPFKVYGVAEFPLVEDPSLVSGSTTITENPDGTQSVNAPVTSNQCQHNAEFFANPDFESVIAQQQHEIELRNQAALAAAQQQAEGQ